MKSMEPAIQAWQRTPLHFVALWLSGCLKVCWSPLNFFRRFYQRGVGPAWHLGLHHGTFCLGCCWALMLVMFGIGVGSVVWMAALAGVMVIEKVAPGGQWLRLVVGVFLFVLAGVWLRFCPVGGHHLLVNVC
jgi:predicted metal-binding membrane protein